MLIKQNITVFRPWQPEEDNLWEISGFLKGLWRGGRWVEMQERKLNLHGWHGMMMRKKGGGEYVRQSLCGNYESVQ